MKDIDQQWVKKYDSCVDTALNGINPDSVCENNASNWSLSNQEARDPSSRQPGRSHVDTRYGEFVEELRMKHKDASDVYTKDQSLQKNHDSDASEGVYKRQYESQPKTSDDSNNAVVIKLDHKYSNIPSKQQQHNFPVNISLVSDVPGDKLVWRTVDYLNNGGNIGGYRKQIYARPYDKRKNKFFSSPYSSSSSGKIFVL